MEGKYILDGHTPVEEEDLKKWAQWLQDTDLRVKLTELENNIKVSTVFLGLDFRYGNDGPPLLFETMIIGGEHHGYQKRYSTWEEAEAGHEEALKLTNMMN